MSTLLQINADLAAHRGVPDAAELQALKESGFRAVVDLRLPEEREHGLAPAEEKAEAERIGLAYSNVPVSPQRVDPSQLDVFRAEVARLPRPIVVHCASGKRSGSFAMVEAALREGLSGDEMLRRADDLGVGQRSPEIRQTYRRYVDEYLPRAPMPEAGPLPPTTSRVERHTHEAFNRRIAAATEQSIRELAANPQRIDERLAELDREWDMERTLEANAAAIALAGTVLGAAVDRRFLVLPAFVAGFLLQHALQGWCPPVRFFRRRGVRTAREIAHERNALKALRGDYHDVDSVRDPAARADAALLAARS